MYSTQMVLFMCDNVFGSIIYTYAAVSWPSIIWKMFFSLYLVWKSQMKRSFHPFLLAENLSRFVYAFCFWHCGHLCNR